MLMRFQLSKWLLVVALVGCGSDRISGVGNGVGELPDGGSLPDPVAGPPLAPAGALPVLSQAQLIHHFYQVLLGRIPDAPGFDLQVAAMQGGQPATLIFAGLLASAELTANPQLRDRAQYLTRLCKVLLERDPKPGEIAGWLKGLAEANGSAGGMYWWEAFASVLSSEEYKSVPRPIAGVHFPLPINPDVTFTDADYVTHLYAVLLARAPEVGGLRARVRQVRASGRAAPFTDLIRSPEFQGNAALGDRTQYVQRLFQVLLKRAPAAGELAARLAGLGTPGADGSAPGWRELYDALASSSELKAVTCQTSYFTYGEALSRNVPLLKDVVEGKARIQGVTESIPVADVPSQDGSKLAFFKTDTGRRFAFSRVARTDTTIPSGIRFNVRAYELTATPQKTLTQIPQDLFDPADYDTFAHSIYDPQISVDESVCPRRYILSLECDGSYCLSYSSTPLVPESWSPPVQVVAASTNPFRSASTGKAVFDHRRMFMAWSEMDSGFNGTLEGIERVFTSAVPVPGSPYTLARHAVTDFGRPVILDSEANINCTSAWDCDNKDGQDWHKEGAYFYMLYNGANYYGCDRAFRNLWGIAVARDTSATGKYPERSAPIMGDQDGTCDLSYPAAHAQDGRLVVTYANQAYSGTTYVRPEPRWAEIVWK